MVKNAKIWLRLMISFGRAEPVAVAKRGRPVVVVMAVEEFERLKALDAPAKREVTFDRQAAPAADFAPDEVDRIAQAAGRVT